MNSRNTRRSPTKKKKTKTTSKITTQRKKTTKNVAKSTTKTNKKTSQARKQVSEAKKVLTLVGDDAAAAKQLGEILDLPPVEDVHDLHKSIDSFMNDNNFRK
jgi:hypothetical protein